MTTTSKKSRWKLFVVLGMLCLAALAALVVVRGYPHMDALARDRQRMMEARDRIADFKPRDADPWVKASKDMAVVDMYERHTGPVDYWYRSAAWMRLEAILDGPLAAGLMCTQVTRQTERLAFAADQALQLSRELETPEAQSLLANALWDERHLIQSMQSDARALDSMRACAEAWGQPAYEIVDKMSNATAAQAALRSLMATQMADAMMQASWVWDQPCDLIPAPSSLLWPSPFIFDRTRELATEGERAQIAAIALFTIAEYRIAAIGDLTAVLRGLTGERAYEFVTSMKGLFDVWSVLWDMMTTDQQTMVRDRANRYLIVPSGFPKACESIASRTRSLSQTVGNRLIDEAEHGSTLEPGDTAVDETGNPLSSEGSSHLTEALMEDVAKDMLDNALLGVDILVLTGAVVNPEPITKTVLILISVALIGWDAFDAWPTYQRAAAARQQVAEGMVAAWIGSPGHGEYRLSDAEDPTDATVLALSQSALPGAILNYELEFWRLLRQRVDTGER